MKKIVQKIIEFFKHFIICILRILGITFEEKTNKSFKSLQKEKITNSKIENRQNKYFENTDTDTNPTHDLEKEHFFIQKQNKLTKEEMEKSFNLFLEKNFKIKLNTLPEETKKEIETYRKKIVQEAENKALDTEENLEIFFKKKIKEELEKKQLNFEEINKNPSLYYRKPTIKPTTEQKLETVENKEIKKNISLTTSTENYTKKELVTTPNELLSRASNERKQEQKIPSIQNERKTVEEQKITFEAPIIEEENAKQVEITPLEKVPTIFMNQEIQPLQEKESKEQTVPIESKKENPEEKKEESKQEITEKEKEPEKTEYLNLTNMELENNKIIENATRECQKEEFIDKNYEQVEKLLEEKIAGIEKKLQKPLTELQKKTLKNELKKLKETKQKVYLFKEKDIEELRISLEENIPLEELMLVTDKLNKLTEDEEIKRKEILYKDIENKTNKEMQEIEKVLIKESYKRALRRLELPLFLSFPFIKNKHFRRFVSGLFLFRTFGFIKNIIFGFPDTYEPLDLSYIQKGSDALIESINLTEKNRASFQHLKQAILLKYPELMRDEAFMNDINKLEENLKKNYEKLLKQEQLVNKYFDKSKIFTRERKRTI